MAMTNKERAHQIVERWCHNPQSRYYRDAVSAIAAALGEAEKRGMERATETMTAEELENILDSTIRALQEKRPKKTYILVPKP